MEIVRGLGVGYDIAPLLRLETHNACSLPVLSTGNKVEPGAAGSPANHREPCQVHLDTATVSLATPRSLCKSEPPEETRMQG